jgi:hypothetical protein
VHQLPALQKFFLVHLLWIFFLNVNNAIGVGPGSEEWKDQYGKHPPVKVIQAINSLWDAEEAERTAERHKKKALASGPSSQVIWENVLSKMFLPPFLRPEEQNPNAVFDAAMKMWVRRIDELKVALFNFQKTVREHVQGRFWFGDIATDNNHDEWIPDQEWKVQFPSPDQAGNRDMSIILPATLKFVNAWAGWAIES